MKIPVSSILPGKEIMYRETRCMVLEHRQDGVLLLAMPYVKSVFGKTNDFAASELRDLLNGPYLDRLTQGHTGEIIARTVDLTALNGSKQYETCLCMVAPLTLDEIRKYHAILPKPEVWDWSVTPWSTPNVDEDDTWVLGLNTNGNINDNGCTGTHGARPAFLLPPSYAVETEEDPLAQYSTEALAAEVHRRIAAEKE